MSVKWLPLLRLPTRPTSFHRDFKRANVMLVGSGESTRAWSQTSDLRVGTGPTAVDENVLIHRIENRTYEKAAASQTNSEIAFPQDIRKQAKLAVKTNTRSISCSWLTSIVNGK